MSATISSRPLRTESAVWEGLVAALIWGMGLLVLLGLAVIVFVVLASAWPALAQVGLFGFLAHTDWHPTQGQFGLLPMAAATLVTALGSLVLAVPLGMMCAVCIVFYCRGAVRFGLQLSLKLLTGVPSVVFGLVCLHSIVPLIGAVRPPGVSLLAGVIVLTVMIVPTIAVMLETVLQKEAVQIYRSGLALGMRRDRVIRRIILPSISPAIMAASAVAFARAAGETMAVMMVMGNVVRWPNDLLGPARVLTTNIALEMAYAMNLHRAGLFVAGLLILLLVLAVSALGFRALQKGHV